MWFNISKAELDPILASAFGPRLLPNGFEGISARKWVRSAKPMIREVVEIVAMKGASYSPRWGFSLDYVPHVSGGKLRHHASAKAAHIDLVYDPIDYERGDRSKMWCMTVLGLKSERLHPSDTAPLVAQRVEREALQFFRPVQSVVDLPKAFEAKRVRPYVRFGWQNYWQEQFAYALTAALLGDVQVASKLLEEWVSQQRDAIGALESGFRDWFDRIVKIKSSM